MERKSSHPGQKLKASKQRNKVLYSAQGRPVNTTGLFYAQEIGIQKNRLSGKSFIIPIEEIRFLS